MTVQLLRPTCWIEKYFPAESAPVERTVRNWLKNGQIAGRIIGGTYYVFDLPPGEFPQVETEAGMEAKERARERARAIRAGRRT